MIGTTAGYFAKDKDGATTGTTFRVSFENCTNDAVITSSQNSDKYQAGGFIGYCGGSGNYVFTSVTNKKTAVLIGYSRIGGTAKDIGNNPGFIKDEYINMFKIDDYDYYSGRVGENKYKITLWKWHSNSELNQTQGSKEFTYYDSDTKLSGDEWRFTFDNKHYKFKANAVGIRGIEDGVEQTSHISISSDPNAYVVEGITVTYVKNKLISGTEQTWTGYMATIGAGTYTFDPTDYILPSERDDFTITNNGNDTWTVVATN